MSTTDGSGQYQITDLRPGVYTVTFTLSGFSVLRREGIQLPAAFTATLNAELKVGALAETLTVTGQSPVVDNSECGVAVGDEPQHPRHDPDGKGRVVGRPAHCGHDNLEPRRRGSKGMQQPTLQVQGSASSDNTYQQDGVTIQHVALNALLKQRGLPALVTTAPGRF